MKKLVLIAVPVVTLIVTGKSEAQVGIGTNSPQANLHVAEGSVVFTSEGDLPASPPPPPVSGTGRRLMWYADKGAFRAGYAFTDDWDLAKTGDYSVALGYSNQAIGSRSTALGAISRATGSQSVAIGSIARAMGSGAVAIGIQADAIAGSSVAIGNSSRAQGEFSMALGTLTSASSKYETAVGLLNTDYTPANTVYDRLFVIGNGTDAISDIKSDALTVLKNGNVGIGFGVKSAVIESYRFSVNGNAAKPGSSTWAVTSDARVKRNIRDYAPGLREVLAIRPVRFQYNRLSGYADTTRHYVGVIAQEIEKILPSTVTSIPGDSLVKDKRVYDGSELVYTLVNAIKELHAQNQELHRTIGKLETANEKIQAALGDAHRREHLMQSRIQKIEVMLDQMVPARPVALGKIPNP